MESVLQLLYAWIPMSLNHTPITFNSADKPSVITYIKNLWFKSDRTLLAFVALYN